MKNDRGMVEGNAEAQSIGSETRRRREGENEKGARKVKIYRRQLVPAARESIAPSASKIYLKKNKERKKGKYIQSGGVSLREAFTRAIPRESWNRGLNKPTRRF